MKVCPHCGGGLGEPTDEDFDWFWSRYPRRVAKKSARKAFRRLSLVDIAILRGTLSAWVKEFSSREHSYIPHPATFLNSGAWEDKPNKEKPQTQSDVMKGNIQYDRKRKDCDLCGGMGWSYEESGVKRCPLCNS